MKIIVTGGAGQLGTLVLRRLLTDSAITQVVSLDVRPPIVASEKLTHVIADVRNPDLARHFQGAEAVIHLAFIVTRVIARDDFESINVFGSKNVFTQAYAAGVRQFVYASSVAAYGVVDRTDVVTEATPRVRDARFPYAACKYDVEEFLDEWEAAHTDVVVARMRPSVLMGGRIEHNLGVALKQRVLPALPRPIPMVWDEDVADAFLLALKKKAKGAFTLSCDHALNGAELAAAAGLTLLPMPEGILRATLALSDFLSKRGVGVDPAWVRAALTELAPYDTSRARSELGWNPTCPTAESVIRRFVDTDPGRMAPRLWAFFKLFDWGSSNVPPVPELAGLTAAMHLWLVGPGGGDVTVQVRDGRLRVSVGVPRPPTSVVRMRTSTFMDVVAGRLDATSAEASGLLEASGDASGTLILRALVARAPIGEASAKGFVHRALSFWFAQ